MKLNPIETGARWTEYEEAHGCFFLGGLFGFLGASQAANAQLQAEQQALQFQQQVYGQTQQNLLPFLQGGTQEWQQLLKGIGTPQFPGILTESPARFGGLPSAPPAYNYIAPTLSTFQASPGYQWQLGQGISAVQNAATGRGLGGNTLQQLQTYGTGLANQDWWNYLNNYQNQYNTAYQANTQNYWNRYGAAANTQQNLYNRIAAPAQAGQQAANTLGTQGTSFAGLIGNQLNQIGASNAAGIVGQYNALAQMFPGSNPNNNPNNNPYGGGGGVFGNLFNSFGSGGYGGAAGYTPLVNSLSAYTPMVNPGLGGANIAY